MRPDQRMNISLNIPGALLKSVEVDSSWLVLFQWEGLTGEDAGRNLRLYNKDGVLIWRIQPPPGDGTNPWSSFYFHSTLSRWVVATADGYDYFIDLANGHTTLFQRSH